MPSSHRKSPRSTTSPLIAALGAAVVLSAATFTLVGCGSDSGTLPITGGSNNGTSAYAGQRVSTLTLPDGKTGVLDITTASDGRITGTLTISEARSTTAGKTRQAFSFAIGTYSVAGFVNPATGAFSLSGSIGGQPFSVTGTFSPNGTGGSYTLTAGGQTITGSFGNGGSTPTPSPSASPSAGASPTPTPSPSSSTTSQGGSSTLVFTNNTTNLTQPLPPFDSPTYTGGNVIPGSIAGVNRYSVSATYGKGQVGIVRAFSVEVNSLNPVTPGAYDFNSVASGLPRASASYTESTSASGIKMYSATSGKIEVVAISGTHVTFRLTDIIMTPTVDATGSFTVNGEITVDLPTH